jgi:TAT (twin-arginine translocation) pathway signal sequence
MTGIDRRQFLVAGAGATGAALTGGTGAWAASARRPVDARAATYRALVRSLRAAPDERFRSADAATAHRRYTRWYAAQPDAVRRHADAVLDAVNAGRPPRYAELAAPPSDASGVWRCATVAAAIALACVGCEPPPGEDERPDLPTLARA